MLHPREQWSLPAQHLVQWQHTHVTLAMYLILIQVEHVVLMDCGQEGLPNVKVILLTPIIINMGLVSIIKKIHYIDCSAADCGPPSEIPSNGVVSFNETIFQSTAIYSCHEGYVLNPLESDVRQCLANETWSGIDPTCERKCVESFLSPTKLR